MERSEDTASHENVVKDEAKHLGSGSVHVACAASDRTTAIDPVLLQIQVLDFHVRIGENSALLAHWWVVV